MKKLNNLKSFESYIKEEFNPISKEDWGKVGGSIRRGFGFLTPEEAIEKGRKVVMNHPMRSEMYKEILINAPEKADKYLEFWGNNDEINSNPVWSSKRGEFVDRSKRYSPPGTIAPGN